MRSNKKPEIVVARAQTAPIPAFVELIHRHLEKAKPSGEVEKGHTKFNVPVDLVRIPAGEALTDEIEEIYFFYAKA